MHRPFTAAEVAAAVIALRAWQEGVLCCAYTAGPRAGIPPAL